jgi:hypothetical protein
MSVYAIGSNIGPQAIVIAVDVNRRAAVRQRIKLPTDQRGIDPGCVG